MEAPPKGKWSYSKGALSYTLRDRKGKIEATAYSLYYANAIVSMMNEKEGL